MNRAISGGLGFTILALSLFAHAATSPATKPTTRATTKPTTKSTTKPTTKKTRSTTVPALGEQDSLEDELILFSAPPNPPWAPGEHKPGAAIFTTIDRLGQMQIAILPKDAAMGDNAAAAIATQLRKTIQGQCEGCDARNRREGFAV